MTITPAQSRRTKYVPSVGRPAGSNGMSVLGRGGGSGGTRVPSRVCTNVDCRRPTPLHQRREGGLCSACYADDEVREHYASTAKSKPLPAAPTHAAPGTVDKMLVMEERALAQTQLFHPFDARYDGDPLPRYWERGVRDLEALRGVGVLKECYPVS